MSTRISHQRPLCVGIGEVLWDLLPGGKVMGGAPVNVAAHAAQLGLRSAAVSGVGSDADGQEILRRLGRLNVSGEGIQTVNDLPTGVVHVQLSEAGVPTFSIGTPAAWDAITFDESLEHLAGQAEAIVFGLLAQRDPRSRQAIGRFLVAARPQCLKVFDINLRPPFIDKRIICSSLEQADVLKLNDAELPLVAKMLYLAGDETAQLQVLRKRFDLDLLILTRGGLGSRMLTAEQDECHAGYSAEVVDTVGAGDAFTAATTVGWLAGMELARLQDLANRVAAFVCSQAGATPRLPLELVHAFHI